jgi:nitrite reductase (NADH) small subunit
MTPGSTGRGRAPAGEDRGPVRVGSAADFPEGSAVPVTLGARRIVIYRHQGVLHAVKDICPHMGEPLHRLPPGDGEAVCLGHGWRFDLETGRCVRGDPEARVAVYPVEVRGDAVLVRIGR